MTRCVLPAIAAVLALAGAAAAQVPGPSVVIQYVPKDVEGTVAGMRPGAMLVSTGQNDAWTFQLPGDMTVRIVGKAEADQIRAGQYIRFQATVDKKQSKVVDKVSRVTLFTPGKDDLRTPGVFLPGQCLDAADLKFKEKELPDGLSADPAKLFNSITQPEEKSKSESKNGSESNEQLFDIHAQITAVKGSTLTINAPNSRFKSTLRMELADNPAIDLDLTDFSLVKPGDKVIGRGIQLGPRLLQCTDMVIRLAEPLGNPKKKPAKPAAKSAATKSST
jgi:hypothetical protein